MDSSELKSGLNDLKLRLIDIREGVFDVTSKENRLKQIEDDLAKEEVWSDLELSQKISKEKTALEDFWDLNGLQFRFCFPREA